MGNAADDTTPSPVLDVDTGIVTSASGWLVSFTVNVAMPPPSVVCPEIPETVKPAVSLSAIVTVAEFGTITVYPPDANVTTTFSGASAIRSSITVTGIVTNSDPAGITTVPGSAV